MKRLLFIDPAACTGCRDCVRACAGRDGKGEDPGRARISIEAEKERFRAHFCMQCKVAECAFACPKDAIRHYPGLDYWGIDYDQCIGCKACVVACPLGAMYIDPAADMVIKCDTCQGEPVCAKACPTGALAYIDPADRKAYLKSRGRGA